MQKIKTTEPAGYKIIGIQQITHDTKALRFQLPADAALDFIPGDHMMITAEIDEQIHQRPYTPTSTPDDVGFFELIIKQFQNGLVSGNIHKKNIGDKVRMDGPNVGGHFEPGMAKNIGMIAGGAGITPMISIIRTAIRRDYDVQMSLLYANKAFDDIILHDEFSNYAAARTNFRCLFSLDNPPANWPGHSGFIDEELIRKHLPSPAESTVIFLCGPPAMEYKLRQKLLEIGYNKKQIIIP